MPPPPSASRCASRAAAPHAAVLESWKAPDPARVLQYLAVQRTIKNAERRDVETDFDNPVNDTDGEPRENRKDKKERIAKERAAAGQGPDLRKSLKIPSVGAFEDESGPAAPEV